MKQVNYIFSKSELEEINRINKIMALRFKKDFDQISLQSFNDILTLILDISNIKNIFFAFVVKKVEFIRAKWNLFVQSGIYFFNSPILSRILFLHI